jgi:hypothetical protein
MSLQAVTFRDRLTRNVPRWAQGWAISRFLYAIGLHLDLLATLLLQGVRAKFPGSVGYAAIEVTGSERGIRRGLYESDIDFAARQRQYLQTQATAGSTYALLTRVREALLPHTCEVRLVSSSPDPELPANLWVMSAAGDIMSYGPDTTDTWNWDDSYGQQSRFWVELVEPDWLFDGGALWTEGDMSVWSDVYDQLWGLDADTTPDQLVRLQGTIQDWTPPSAHHMHTIIRHENTLALPDGTWQYSGNRDAHRVFISGMSNAH